MSDKVKQMEEELAKLETMYNELAGGAPTATFQQLHAQQLTVLRCISAVVVEIAQAATFAAIQAKREKV